MSGLDLIPSVSGYYYVSDEVVGELIPNVEEGADRMRCSSQT